MVWAKLDDGFFDHPKARAAGKDGRELFLAGLCHAAGNLTDGFIAASDLPLLAAKAEVNGRRTVRRLVEVGWWHETDGGWTIHDFLARNPSKAKVEEERQAGAERQRRSRESRRDSHRDSHRDDDVTNGVSAGDPSRPVPLDTSLSPPGQDPSTRPTDDEIEAEAARRTAATPGVRDPARYAAQCATELRATGWTPTRSDSTTGALPDAATVIANALPAPDELAPPPADLRPHRRTG